jgi:hypothetical protein
MSSPLLLVTIVCKWCSAIGAVVGIALLLACALVPANAVAAYRDSCLSFFAILLLSVGAVYVFVSNKTPASARLNGSNVDVFAGLPRPFQWLAPAITGLSFIAFFVAIELVESNRLPRSSGEVFILGAFCVGAFVSIFSGCWSAERVIHRGA